MIKYKFIIIQYTTVKKIQQLKKLEIKMLRILLLMYLNLKNNL